MDINSSRNDNKVAWYENIDGKGTFGAQQTISTDAMGGYGVFVNLDGDGDFDVASASNYDKK